MDKHAAYALAAKELERLAGLPFHELAARAGKDSLEDRVISGSEEFVLWTNVDWADARTLHVSVTVDSPSTHAFERLEERVFVALPK